MTIEQVSAVSQLDAYRRAAAAAHRSPEVAPDARQAAEQENDARRVAESVSGSSPASLAGPDGQPVAASVGTRVDVIPVPADPAGSLERAGQQIERAYASGSPTPEEMRAAEEAYRVQAGARDDLARSAQAEGARSLDITV
jgi:hypothetical protein